MLHSKTSQSPWSLASDMAESHNSTESTLGTDRPQSAALFSAALLELAGMSRSTGCPLQPGCWGHSAIIPALSLAARGVLRWPEAAESCERGCTEQQRASEHAGL